MSIRAVNRSTEIAYVVMEYLSEKPVVNAFLVIQRVLAKCFCVRNDFLEWDTWISDREFSSLDLTRQLTSTQRRAINSPLVSAQKVYEFALKLRTEAGLIDLAIDFENYALHPRYALIAHLKEKGVTVEQVASRCLLYQAIRQFIMQRTVFVHYELPDGPQTVQATSIRIAVPNMGELPELRMHCISENDEALKFYFALNAERMRSLFARLQSKPLSERYYYTIPLPLGEISNWSPGYKGIVDILGFLHPIPMKNSIQFEKINSQVLLIPSYSMLVECSKIRHGEDAISYVPLLGICTESTIEFYKMLDQRVFHIGVLGADVLDEADGSWHGPFIYSMHDYYHGERDSWLRKLHRKAIYYIAGILFDPPINKNTRRIRWALINGELYEPGESFGELFDRKRVPWDDTHIRAVLTNMATLPVYWERVFNITAQQLNRTEKNRYDALAQTITTADTHRAECRMAKYRLVKPTKPRSWERRGSK